MAERRHASFVSVVPAGEGDAVWHARRRQRDVPHAHTHTYVYVTSELSTSSYARSALSFLPLLFPLCPWETSGRFRDHFEPATSSTENDLGVPLPVSRVRRREDRIARKLTHPLYCWTKLFDRAILLRGISTWPSDRDIYIFTCLFLFILLIH